MAALLGVDVGTKRIGIAKSDELGMMAHAIEFFDRTTNEGCAQKLAQYSEEYRIAKIIVGMPINMDGTRGIASEHIEEFVAFLRTQLSTPIETWDERLTTKEAMSYMSYSGMSGSKKRQKVDALAAQIMLQNYLDAHRTPLS